MIPITGTIHRHPDRHSASRALAESFAARAEQAVAERGRFDAALTGGGSPVEAYRLLGSPEFRERVPWGYTHLFWGDERCVPPGHPRSNFRMARDSFLSRVPLPPENVHRMRGELPPHEGREEYARRLEAHFAGGPPVFDLVHLGVGEDGHIASLFPFSRLLRERERAVAVALYRPMGECRLTLTVPVINAARRVEVLLFDPGKAAIARTAVTGARDPFHYPVQLVRPRGDLVWMM